MSVAKFEKNNIILLATIPRGTKSFDTGIPTITDTVVLEILDLDGRTRDIKHILFVNKKNNIVIQFVSTTKETITVKLFRMSAIEDVMADSPKGFTTGIKQAFQALQDVAARLSDMGTFVEDATVNTITSTVLVTIATFFKSLRSLLFFDHTGSADLDDSIKPDKNPIYGKVVALGEPNITAKLLQKYTTVYSPIAYLLDKSSGLNRLPIKPGRLKQSYTPIRSMGVSNNGLSVVLKKAIYDPRYEEKKLLYRFPNLQKHGIIILGPNRYETEYKETAGEIILTVSSITELKTCNMGILLDGQAIPLEIYFTSRR